jgi:lauroyl/myristoyl acyltransferase
MVSQQRRYLVRATQAVIHGLTLHRPELALRVAGYVGALAALRRSGWRAPAAVELTSILGALEATRLHQIRRQIASVQSRNDALAEILRHRGLEPIAPLLTMVQAETLLRCREEGKPTIVIGWHHGPLRASGLALRKLGIPALYGVVDITREPDGECDLVRYASLEDRAAEARFLKRAHHALKSGVVVGLNLDCALGGEPVSFLGRQILMGRSAAALARLTGARLVPVTRRFVGTTGRIEVIFHEPIDDTDLDVADGAEYEGALLRRAARRLEIEARKDPGSWRPSRVHWLFNAPPASDEAGGEVPI